MQTYFTLLKSKIKFWPIHDTQMYALVALRNMEESGV